MGTQDRLRRGYDALASGDWTLAEKLFDEAVQDDPTPEALDGLGRARWWRKDVRSAMDLRTRAHRGFKAEGRTEQAARVAVWLAREHRTLFRNDAAADGWLARARTLAAEPDSALAGWVALAGAEAARSPSSRSASATRARPGPPARRPGPRDRRARQAGTLHVARATSTRASACSTRRWPERRPGRPRDLQSVATAYCLLLEAGELLGDTARFAQWTAAMASAGSGQGLGPLQSLAPAAAYGNLAVFCGACCGGVLPGHREARRRRGRAAVGDRRAGRERDDAPAASTR